MQRILITLPVYNESNVITDTVHTVHDWCVKNLFDVDWNILIADNGSDDDTAVKAQQLTEIFPRVQLFHTPEKGRGQALRRAWLFHEADIYVYMDIDLAVDMAALQPLIKSLREETADIAIGSRFVPGASVTRNMMREATSRAYNFLVHLMLQLPVKDTQCGFKGMTRQVATALLSQTKDDGWFWDTELLTLGYAQGFSVLEIPVTWVETRTPGRKSKVALLRTIGNYLVNLAKLRWRKSHIKNR